MKEHKEGSIEEEPKPKLLNLLTNREAVEAALLKVENAIGRPEKHLEEWISYVKEAISDTLPSIKEATVRGDAKKMVIETFEGIGGFNRYEIWEDGTVWIDEPHGHLESLEEAVRLGIGVSWHGQVYHRGCFCGSGKKYKECHGA